MCGKVSLSLSLSVSLSPPPRPALLSEQADGAQPTTSSSLAILAYVPVCEVGSSGALKPLVVIHIVHRHMAALFGMRRMRGAKWV